MAVTISPSVEATNAIVARINATTTYALEVVAAVSDTLVDPMQQVTGLRVDVCHETEEQLVETLDVEDRTSHEIRVWIRAHAGTQTPDELNPLKLIVRQIWQQINNFNSSDGRVKVWDCDIENRQIPDKGILNQVGMFVVSILIRVEVEASA